MWDFWVSQTMRWSLKLIGDRMKKYKLCLILVTLLTLHNTTVIAEPTNAKKISPIQPGQPQPPTQFPYIYSVKFICGLQILPTNTTQFPPPQEPPVKPGNYATSVNIHNFWNTESFIFTKAVIAGGIVGPFSGVVIGPNRAITIDCTQIFRMLGGVPANQPFIEGFVEIGSRTKLSVAAVYTSQTCYNPGTTTRCSQLGELSTSVVNQRPM